MTKPAPRQNFLYCKQQITGHSRFRDVTFRARRKRSGLEIEIVVQRQEHYLDLCVALLYSLSDFDSAHKRHRNIENTNIRLQTIDRFQKRWPVSDGAQYVKLPSQQTYNQVPNFLMIIRN